MTNLLRSALFTALLVFPLFASALQPGDVAVIGLYADSPDETAFVALVDLPGGTVINITDAGWKSSGEFRSGENHVAWIAPAGGVAAGSVISVSMSGISNSGDQIILYAGSSTNPTPLFAVNDQGSDWQDDATSNNNSALPDGLTDGATAVA